MPLHNYSLLIGKVTKDLEEHIKRTMTHHNFILTAQGIDYQINIDIQSTESPNVKVYFIPDFDKSKIQGLSDFLDEGMHIITSEPRADHVDYLRSQVFDASQFGQLAPTPRKEISELLDQNIIIGSKISIFGESYDDDKDFIESHRQHYGYGEDEPERLPQGIQLRRTYPHLPKKGIHDTHYNQGTATSSHLSKANGTYQDGGIVVENDGKTSAFFFMFANQSLATDDKGNPV